MTEMIPPYLDIDSRKSSFIRIAENSKAPQKGNSAKDGPFFDITDSQLQKHIQNGGNVGRVFRDSLIGIDVDHRILIDELDTWPETLVVESGGNGFGCHYYFRVPGWDRNQTELTADGMNIGSIRSGNSYCLVPPSRHDESGNKYTVSNPRNPAEISASRLSSLAEKYGTANTGGGGPGGSAAAAAGVGSDAPIPEEYPNREVDWNTARSWLQASDFLSDLNRTTSRDWSGLEFKLAKCLAEGGFSESTIHQTLDRLSHKSKWHNREQNYRNLTVQKAIESAVSDSYVEFDNPNDGKESGRDLPEGQTGQVQTMSENDSTFKSKESVIEHNGNGKAVQVRLMQGTDGESGETFEYVDVATGEIVETESIDGETVEVPQIEDGPGQTDSLGSPADLELKIKALKELKEQIE
jgi:hypothetical protein